MAATMTLHDHPAPRRSCDRGPATWFHLTLRDGASEEVHGADAYQQEGSMTTFFRTDGRPTVDCWSVRVASFRTEQIMAVRRREGSPG